MSPRPSRSGTRTPRDRRRAAAPGREDHPGPRLHLHARDGQRDRGLARQLAGPCLRQCPPAADLDPQPRPHDAVLGGLGRAGTGRAFRRAAALLRADRRLDAVPLLASCRRRRPYADRRPDRRRQERAPGADGAAVPPLCRRRRSSPSTSAARSAPRRSPWAATGTTSAARSSEDVAEPVALQPLARIDDAGERAWAAEWVAALLARESVTITPGAQGTSVVGADLARLRARRGADAHRPLGAAAVERAEAGACSPTPSPVPGAGCSTPRPSGSARPTFRPSRPRGSIGAGAAPAVLSYLFHRIEDRFDGRPTLAHHRRGLARARRSRLRRPAPRVAEDAAQEERVRHLRHPVARRHRRQRRSRRRSSRAARPASSCPTSARSSRRSPRSIAASGSTTARSRS